MRSLPIYLRPFLELHPALVAKAVRRRDVGYACYLYFGVVLTAAFLLNRLPTGSRLYGLVADAFGAAVFFGFFLAGVVGVWTSALTWRDRPLLALGLLTLTIPAVLWAAARWPWVGDWGAALYFTAFTLLALALPARWFFSLRRRLLQAADPGS